MSELILDANDIEMLKDTPAGRAFLQMPNSVPNTAAALLVVANYLGEISHRMDDLTEVLDGVRYGVLKLAQKGGSE